MKDGEKPIKLFIYQFGAEANFGSHAAMEYNGEVIDYSSEGFNRYGKSRKDCKIYELYPSEIGVDPDKLMEAIKERKAKIQGSDYNYVGNNCARQVIACLEAAGAKDIPQPLGIAVPSIPLFNDLEDWARNNGYLVSENLSSKESNPLYKKFTNGIEILCGREEYKKKIREELLHPKKPLSVILAEQSQNAFSALGSDKVEEERAPTAADYKEYLEKKALLLKSDEEILNMVIDSYKSLVDPRLDAAIKNGYEGQLDFDVKNMDFAMREVFQEFANRHVDKMPCEVMEKLKKEGIVFGYKDSILEKSKRKRNVFDSRYAVPERQIT